MATLKRKGSLKNCKLILILNLQFFSLVPKPGNSFVQNENKISFIYDIEKQNLKYYEEEYSKMINLLQEIRSDPTKFKYLSFFS